MDDHYFTLANISHSIYKEKRSKFLGFAFNVTSEEEIKEKLTFLKEKYNDARHHCYAYSIDINENKTRAFDDGEPYNSAGTPILGQIRSHHLINVLIVVVRYFGGVKLGVGGLTQAYKETAKLAIQNNDIVRKKIMSLCTIRFSYENTSFVMKKMKQYNTLIKEQYFDSNFLTITFEIPYDLKEKIHTDILKNQKKPIIFV